jgi:protein-tyrosine phosphatase
VRVPATVRTTLGGIDVPRILLVCTANQCRSPMAEGLLRRLLDDRGVEADVSSAGLYEGGARATVAAHDALAARGIDLSAHRSRNLAEPDVDATTADLVIGMERRHIQEVVLLGAEQARCFTLPDLARRATAAEPRRAGETLAAWASRVGADRTFADFVGLGPAADEVADPIGRSADVYEATVESLLGLLTTVVDRAFPPITAEHVA